MTIDSVFVVLLIGHVLGDFYLQTNSIAEKKDVSYRCFVIHIMEYTISMGVVLILAIPYSNNLLFIWLSSSLLHLCVDLIKRAAKRFIKNNALKIYLENRSFIIDQVLHLCSLIAIWYFWGSNLVVRPFIEQDIIDFPDKPIVILLCFLCILRPVGILIGKGELWDFKKHNMQPVTKVQNAGKMIGYLERTIVLFFLIYQQYGAIAFILTAKSVARFKEIETSRDMAEYYLIGTLLSVVSVFILAFLLGLCSVT
ncbi:MAG: hypothetical protein K0S47_3475 [Herbinix sp.]|jgi:hypothetical protein|nr:hypothetical protein [Herbinix sp.]